MRSRMTVIPKLFSHWWETLERPHRLIDQHFGRSLRPEQFFSSVFDRPLLRRFPLSYYQPWMEEYMKEDECGMSVVKNNKDKFHIALDVKQFKPEEINVKVVDDYIVVEGKHEEKEDDHGIISRHFVRKYLIPEQCDPEKTTSTLTPDGVLTVTAPRRPESIENKKERVIQIEHMANQEAEGEPAKIKQRQ